MKKLLMFLLLIGSFPNLIHAESSGVYSRYVVDVSRFKGSDDITAIGASVTGTAAYYAYPSAIKQQAILFPTQIGGIGITITASFQTPNDVVAVPGSHLYALVHLAGATNTAQLAATTIQGSAYGSITGTAAYPGLTSGLGISPIPTGASVSIQRYELQTVSTTATAPLVFQPNRLVHVQVYSVGATNQIIELYGLELDYIHDPKKKR